MKKHIDKTVIALIITLLLYFITIGILWYQSSKHISEPIICPECGTEIKYERKDTK